MIKDLWQSHRMALMGFTVAFAALGYFGFKTISTTIYWMDPAHQHQPLAGWMTPRYVAQSYKLPREALLDALFLDANAPPRRIALYNIARENNVSLADLQDRVDAASAAWATEREAGRND